MSQSMYLVPGMSCSHCEVAVTEEVTKVHGVAAVEVDLAAKIVRVRGTELDGDAIVAAIDDAGYDALAA
jgi:copper chaperone CopZ